MKINGINIGRNYPPYVIAEMSANHNGSIENAFEIIKSAKLAGASALKIQTYTPETITLNSKNEDFKVSGGLWDNKYLYDLYSEGQLPYDWHEELFNYARKIGITLFSSPFDNTAVDLLENLNTPAYKIASFEIVDLPLIKYVASTKKPMIISTGMASKEEIEEALETAKENGCKDLSLLHCVSGYPSMPEDYNLLTIVDMLKRFKTTVGLSDHTISNHTAVASISLGASIIEKHFTLDPNKKGLDSEFSINPAQLKDLVKGVNSAWRALGKIDYSSKNVEKESLKHRRSIYCIKKIKKGDKFSLENVKSIRPGYGLSPKFLEKLIGKESNCDIDFATPIDEKFIKGGL